MVILLFHNLDMYDSFNLIIGCASFEFVVMETRKKYGPIWSRPPGHGSVMTGLRAALRPYWNGIWGLVRGMKIELMLDQKGVRPSCSS